MRLPRRWYLHLGLGIALIGLTCALAQHLSHLPPSAPPGRLHDFPMQLGTWSGVEQTWGSEVVTALDVDDWMLRRYEDASGAMVWFYLGFSGNLTLGKGLLSHSPQSCYPANGWERLQSGLQDVTLPTGERIVVNRLLVQKGLEQRLVLYWQQWGERIVPEIILGKGPNRYRIEWQSVRQVLSTLVDHAVHDARTDRALVRVSAPVVHTVEETLAQEIAFVQSAFPILAQRFALQPSPP